MVSSSLRDMSTLFSKGLSLSERPTTRGRPAHQQMTQRVGQVFEERLAHQTLHDLYVCRICLVGREMDISIALVYGETVQPVQWRGEDMGQ